MPLSPFDLIPLSELPFKVFAFPLNGSDLHQFHSESIGANINFEWDSFLQDSKRTLRGVAIAVARRYPELPAAEIQWKSDNLYALRKIRKLDMILGMHHNYQVDVGFVADVIYGEKYFPSQVSIVWQDKNFSMSAIEKGVKTDEIQNFKLDNLPELSGIFQSHFERHRSEFASTERMYNGASQRVFELPEAKYISSDDREDAGGTVTLFFGTNRNLTGLKDPAKHFGSELDKLTVGTCKVTFPRGHVAGAIERPGIFRSIVFGENPLTDVTLDSIEMAPLESFYRDLATRLQVEDPSTALLFIHGYNMSFEEAAWRTGQIVYDLPFNGLGGFFSWPSNGTRSAYLKDQDRVDVSVPYLEDFIERMVVDGNIRQLHMIAHSMGNRLMAFTIKNLALKTGFTAHLKVIREIVLAAPDIDQDVFQKIILPSFRNVGNNRTLYASEFDAALSISEWIRGGLARAGSIKTEIFLGQGIDTIDASNVRGQGNQHSYIFETKEVLGDMHQLLKYGAAPKDRRLRARKKGGHVYWLFPLGN